MRALLLAAVLLVAACAITRVDDWTRLGPWEAGYRATTQKRFP